MKMDNLKLNTLLSLLVLISSVFFLTVKHWTNLIVICLFVGCLHVLTKDETYKLSSLRSRRWCQLISGMLLAPLLAVVLGQIFRFDFYSPNWDGPLRLVLCVPIFLAIAKGKLWPKSNKSITQIWLTTILPLTLLWTLFFRLVWPTRWGPVDLTTYFVDPLTFGSYTLLFSLLITLGVSEYWVKLNGVNKCLCVSGVVSGIYLSVTSGSRTGWINLPVFLCIWAFFVLKPRIGIKLSSLLLAFLVTVLFIALAKNAYLLNKFVLVWNEIVGYKWNEPNADTSVGLRLSFYRMGLTYFLESPFTGWGDLGWTVQMNQQEFSKFASDYARESPRHGFHNEIITSAVRSGIWGLIASLGFFAIVFVRAIQGIRLKTMGDHRLISLTLLVFISHLFIAGLTTEITNLVFLSSFIGLTLAVLLGEQIYLEANLQ